jgi:hypothetical protein
MRTRAPTTSRRPAQPCRRNGVLGVGLGVAELPERAYSDTLMLETSWLVLTALVSTDSAVGHHRRGRRRMRRVCAEGGSEGRSGRVCRVHDGTFRRQLHAAASNRAHHRQHWKRPGIRRIRRRRRRIVLGNRSRSALRPRSCDRHPRDRTGGTTNVRVSRGLGATAVIHVTVSRAEIRNVMGPGINELKATCPPRMRIPSRHSRSTRPGGWPRLKVARFLVSRQAPSISAEPAPAERHQRACQDDRRVGQAGCLAASGRGTCATAGSTNLRSLAGGSASAGPHGATRRRWIA